MNTFKDFGAAQDPSEDDKIMHSQIDTDKGVLFMAADTPNSYPYSQGTDMYMSLSGDDEAELRGYFDKLAVGGRSTAADGGALGRHVWQPPG